MKLNKITILPMYNSYETNVVETFYNKTLACATNYDRVSAYFDSNILALYEEGLYNAYQNKGHVRFIFSCDISEEDYNQMKEGYKNRENIENQLLQLISYDELTEEEKMRFSNLAYLIQIGLIDIKIAFTKQGIFHDKFGIIYDDTDKVYFRGSNNETIAAIKYSYESFETSCTWNCSDNELLKISKATQDFESLWNNNKDGIITLDIPEIVKNKIIQYSDGKYHDIMQIIYRNKLVLDIDNNNRLLCKNFLMPNKIDIRDIIIKVFLKKYLISASNEKLDFKDNLNYIDIKNIISKLTSYAHEKFFDLYITDKLKNYIELMDIKIDKRKNLGIDIKERAKYLIKKYDEFSTIVNLEMKRKLRESQMWNAFHIVLMIRASNFSVPGAGKTSIVYGAFSYLNRSEDKAVDKMVVIGPKNSFLAWREEFKLNFGDKKELRLLDVQDEKYKNKADLIESLKYGSGNCNLILINYEKLEGFTDLISNIITDRTILVFDEVHKIKSINGVRAKSALKICKGAKYKVALTGTPIPNSYVDLYNLLNILYNEEYESYFGFTPAKLKKADYNEAISQEINEKIYPFYCRTTKRDLKIPVPNEPKLIEVKMNYKEKRLFENIRKLYGRNILTLYIRLLQAATTPKLLLKKIDENQMNSLLYTEEEEITENNLSGTDIDNTIKLDYETRQLINSINETGKFTEGIKLVSQIVKEGKQVLVWGIFIETLNNISEKLNQLGISNKIIYGATSQSNREEIINEFKTCKINVLITNPHTLAESVSLHQTCHDAVYFEYSFNLTHMLQSRDRINRLGLPENQYTQYYYLMLCNDDIYNDSIDKKTLKRLDEKEQEMIKAIEGTSLTRVDYNDLDDIREILSKV